ncbi:hypothetical protein B0H11DRAFT_2416827 [Mycena galericulata]|nr:hypothetical protein B0H11DRAFT_2416827 [Mycena galericulata]
MFLGSYTAMESSPVKIRLGCRMSSTNRGIVDFYPTNSPESKNYALFQFRISVWSQRLEMNPSVGIESVHVSGVNTSNIIESWKLESVSPVHRSLKYQDDTFLLQLSQQALPKTPLGADADPCQPACQYGQWEIRLTTEKKKWRDIPGNGTKSAEAFPDPPSGLLGFHQSWPSRVSDSEISKPVVFSGGSVGFELWQPVFSG